MAAETVETVNVVVSDSDGPLTSLVIPAHTVSPGDLAAKVKNLANVYRQQSQATGMGQSLGDFALFLLAEAARESHRLDRAV